MKTILITVDCKGQITVETRGFQGAECRQASQFLEQAMGTQVREQLTAEYHSINSQHPPLNQGQ